MDINQRALQLLEKFEQDIASEEELRELDEWYQSFEQDPKFTTNLNKQEQISAREKLLHKINTRLDRESVDSITAESKKQIWLWPRMAAAATILMILSVTGYFFWQRNQATPQTAQIEKQDIAPGNNKAILTLGNGQQIILASAKNGHIATEGNAVVDKTVNGQIVYHQRQSSTTEPVYNMIVTPRGGQYHLTLADGTNVWLNAASSIRYPTEFTGKERLVELTGEAYFEVTHNAVKPFRVQTSSQSVQVLGTHFNINAYNDEPVVKTTLLEGSVSVHSGVVSALIKPGEQAILTHNLFKVIEVDTDTEMAWKDGGLRFTDENLESVMRKISRWYDVDIEYENNGMKQLPLTGIIVHSPPLSKVLRMLELTRQVHFKVAGKKIIVTK